MIDRPSSPDSASGAPRGGVMPMSAIAALGWTAATTFAFLWLYTLLVYVRPAAEDDVVSLFGCQVVVYLGALFLVLRLHAPEASIRAFLGVRRTHLAFYPLAAALAVALTAPTNALHDAITSRYPEPEVEERLIDTFRGASTPKLALLGFLFVVLGPALEEIFFRGALYQPLQRRYGPAVVVAITAALFAGAHLQWQGFVSFAAVGASLCWLRWASGSLWPGLVLHATYNALPYWTLVTVARGAPETEEAVPLWLALGSTLGVVSLLAVARLLSRAAASRDAKARDLA